MREFRLASNDYQLIVESYTENLMHLIKTSWRHFVEVRGSYTNSSMGLLFRKEDSIGKFANEFVNESGRRFHS